MTSHRATRPRVGARAEIDAITEQRICSPVTYTSPRVLIEVTFDLHDHAAALTALEAAVDNVRTQIEETCP